MTAPQKGKAKVTTPVERQIHIERVFNAPRDRVWKAMTDPALLAQWWGRGNKLVIEKFELHRGGHYRVVEHADGQTNGFEGRFREITAPERIVQSFEWDGMPAYVIIQTMTLEDMGDGRTRLRVVSEFMHNDERDGFLNSGMEGGMNQSYDALDRVLAGMK